jgi:hypothetical protein
MEKWEVISIQFVTILNAVRHALQVLVESDYAVTLSP